MTNSHGDLQSVLAVRLKDCRLAKGVRQEELESKLLLGSGWIESFESGQQFPTLSLLMALVRELDVEPNAIFKALPPIEPASIDRDISAVPTPDGLVVKFKYNRYDASYLLPAATIDEFSCVIDAIRSGLSSSTNSTAKRDAVVSGFLQAVSLWPKANPSDIWWFVIYRAYCDPFNHPAKSARMDHAQSWKRTGGWALEKIVVDHYAPFLKSKGVNIYIADAAEKEDIVNSMSITDRLEADKIDVVLTGDTPDGPKFFGVVHVKASFAERRTDDIHMSQLLKAAGYATPLWTMDCKSSPGDNPINRGELGSASGERSAKRRDIEDEGYFTRCFSYNANTEPSPASLPADRRIYNCDFSDPDDQFSAFILQRWNAFYSP